MSVFPPRVRVLESRRRTHRVRSLSQTGDFHPIQCQAAGRHSYGHPMTAGKRIHQVLNLRVAATRLGIPRKTLRAWSESGVGPLPNHRGLYEQQVVGAWLEETRAQAGQYSTRSFALPSALDRR